MEVYMELSKKTTILFSPELHECLSRLAVERGTSLGDLVRTACERQYCLPTKDEKLAAVRSLAALTLPVGDPKQMKRESVPDPQELLR
jgi:hypothetical protein